MDHHVSPLDPDLRLSPFAFTIKHVVHQALQKAGDGQLAERCSPISDRSDTEHRDKGNGASHEGTRPMTESRFNLAATQAIGAHVALIMEKCQDGRLEAGRSLVNDVDVEAAIAQIMSDAAGTPTPPLLAASGAVALHGAEQMPDVMALREQILANARVLYLHRTTQYGPTGVAMAELLFKNDGPLVIAFIACKGHPFAPAQRFIQSAPCVSDLAALQALDRMLKAEMTIQWP